MLYTPDISHIIPHLDILPSSTIAEAGTSSGSPTALLAHAVAPNRHVHTLDFHAGRPKVAAAEFPDLGLSHMVISKQRDAIKEELLEELAGRVDGLFLDIPNP